MPTQASNDNRRRRAIDRAYEALAEVAGTFGIPAPKVSAARDISLREAEQAENVEVLAYAVLNALEASNQPAYTIASVDWAVGQDYTIIQGADDGNADDYPTE